jgi:hypothetical protein
VAECESVCTVLSPAAFFFLNRPFGGEGEASEQPPPPSMRHPLFLVGMAGESYHRAFRACMLARERGKLTLADLLRTEMLSPNYTRKLMQDAPAYDPDVVIHLEVPEPLSDAPRWAIKALADGSLDRVRGLQPCLYPKSRYAELVAQANEELAKREPAQ